MTQMLSMLPGRCLWSGRSPNDAICCADSSAHIGVIMFCLTWASLLWPRQLQRIMSFDFAALRWTTRWESARWPKNCKKTDDRCSEGQRDLQDQHSIALLSFVSTAINIFARGILVTENSFFRILQKARQMMQINCDLEFFFVHWLMFGMLWR